MQQHDAADWDCPTRARPGSSHSTRCAAAWREVGYLADDSISLGVVFLADRLAQAGPRRGPGRDGQDPAGQVGGRAHRRSAHPAAVLRGARRVQGPLRVELPQAAAADPGRPGAAVGRRRARLVTSSKRTSSPRTSCSTRPLLEAIRATEPVVLLVDEVDRVELETEALLLEMLSEYQVSIPELGHRPGHPAAHGLPHLEQHPRALRGAQAPLPLPARRLPRPRARARSSSRPRCPGSPRSWPTRWPGSCARCAPWSCARRRRSPRRSTGPAPWWCSGRDSIDAAGAVDTLHILLKYQTDIERAPRSCSRPAALGARPCSTSSPGSSPSCAAPGLPVSLTEHLDAAEAVTHIPLEDREVLKYGAGGHAGQVRGALARPSSRPSRSTSPCADGAGGDGEAERERRARPRTPRPGGPAGRARAGGKGGGGEGMTPEELAEMLFKSLLSADAGLMNAVARKRGRPLRRHGAGPPGRRHLLPLPHAAEPRPRRRAGAADGPGAGRAAGGALTELEERLAGDEYQGAHREVPAGGRDRDPAPPGRGPRRRGPGPLGAQAAARGHRRHARHPRGAGHAAPRAPAAVAASWPCAWPASAATGARGPLDFRATVRRSLSTGGVPIEPRFRHPRPAKPEIFVIADISGSVASFARFTLHLVYAISSQFSKVRSFVFVDGIDEVTRFFEGVVDPAEAVARINTEADVIWVDGHSDYGHALSEFHRRWGDQVTSRVERHGARRRPQQLPRLGGRGCSRTSRPGPATSTGSTPSRVTTGARATRSWASTPRTATTWSSAARCASSSTSSATWREPRSPAPPERACGPASEPACRGRDPHRAGAPRRGGVQRHGRVGGPKGCTGLTDLGRAPGRRAGRRGSREWRAGRGDGALRLGAAPRRRDGGASWPRRSGSKPRPRPAGLRRCPSCTRASATASWDEVVEVFGVPDWDRDPASPVAPGGESWISFVERAQRGLERLAADAPRRTGRGGDARRVIEASCSLPFGSPAGARIRG